METQRARRRVVLACLGVLVGVAVTDAAFGCSELATAVEVDLRFDRRFQGTYRPGEPYDVLTVLPNGGGETLAEVGITLRVRFVCNEPGNVTPIVGLPWQEIVLYSPTIGSCTWMYAARSTDANGWTEFVGTFRAGFWWAGVAGIFAAALTATYILRMLARAYFGPLNERWASLRDMRPGEQLAAATLVAFIVLMGVWPDLFLDRISPVVDGLPGLG